MHVSGTTDQLSEHMSDLLEDRPRESLLLQSHKHVTVAQRHRQAEEGVCLLLRQRVHRREGIYTSAVGPCFNHFRSGWEGFNDVDDILFVKPTLLL